MSFQTVLDFWFGELDAEGLPRQEKEKRWFGGGKAMDDEIAARFAHLHRQAAQGALDPWCQSVLGRLALILLLDQFSRHLYRGQAQAFSCDDRALALCREGLARGEDRQLALAHRLFFYMPLQHAEQLSAQRLGVERLTLWLPSLTGAARKRVAEGLRFQQAHLEIIERFGRFPHRNRALGRANRADEEHYLAQGAPRFGQ